MPSVTEICNLALSHLAVGKEIQNFSTDASEEASACRRFYEQVRDEALRDFPWPFATRIVSLALVAENPTSEWAYAYRYPSDCLMARRILSGANPETPATRVPYRVASDATGLLLYTNQANAELEYTVQATDPTFWPVDFRQVVSLLLAAYVAPRVTAGKSELGTQALQLYRYKLSLAQANAGNEEQAHQAIDSEFITIRE